MVDSGPCISTPVTGTVEKAADEARLHSASKQRLNCQLIAYTPSCRPPLNLEAHRSRANLSLRR